MMQLKLTVAIVLTLLMVATTADAQRGGRGFFRRDPPRRHEPRPQPPQQPPQQGAARDPGLRGGDPGAGGPLRGLTERELAFFENGLEDFAEEEEVDEGLGPRMNLNGCGSCHSQPAIGGGSPAVNPQVAFASLNGGTDRVPAFITVNGPIREARFKFNPDGTRDGGVHNTATITGREGADGCTLALPDFAAAAAANNLVFRIPTSVFGLGLVEQIPERTILANLAANSAQKAALGIGGRVNRNGNDGTITRFGWKAQNKSLLLFSGEAYNVEMGITSPLFPQEREENPRCQFATVPNDITDPTITTTPEGLGAIEHFAFFQRFLAPPTPSATTPGGRNSIDAGRRLFTTVGCALCHTPALNTGNNSTTAALNNVNANLYSDLALHQMGPGLADDILQGVAEGDEFRTAFLWGLGQRIFYMHDGRTTDLSEAIQAHASAGNGVYPPSEANGVIARYNALSNSDRQHMLNFLRSL